MIMRSTETARRTMLVIRLWEIAGVKLDNSLFQKYGTMESTPLTVVDTVEGLKKLVETLNKEKEFAIDLEVRGGGG